MELINRKMIKGFAFNRKHFHATDSVISCVLWSNEKDDNTIIWELESFDIKEEEVVKCDKQPIITIKMSKESIAKFNDKRKFPNDVETNIICNSDGTEFVGWNHKTKASIYNDNIIAYMAANGYTPDAKHRYLMRCGYKTGIEQSFGFMVRNDIYLEKRNYESVQQLIDNVNIRFLNKSLSDLDLKENFDYMFLSNISDYLNLMYNSNNLENYRELLIRFLSNVKQIYFAYLYDIGNKNPRSDIDDLDKVKKVFQCFETKTFKSALETNDEKKDGVLILRRK